MPSRKLNIFAYTIALLTGLASSSSIATDDPDITQILEKNIDALVTVKYILTMNMGALSRNQEQETESELTCSMISAEGLVLCSNNQLTGFIGLIKQFSRGAGNDMSAVPKNLQVLVGDEEKPFDAEIIVKDTDLDLVWIRIIDRGDTSFTYLDLSWNAAMNIGDRIITMRRAGNHFGRTPVVTHNRIGGISSKPRTLYIPEIPTNNIAGTPVFSADGKVIGLMVTQLPEPGGNPNSMMSMTSITNMQDAMSGLVLPVSEVYKATRRAMETPTE